jgi:Big-like domain-containing protein
MKRCFPQLSTSTFTAGNKMKRSMSRLNLRSPLALILITFVIAATLITFAVSASRNANRGTDVSPVNHAQDKRATKPLTRIANRRTLTPLAPMPFVSTITATLDDNFPLASKKNPGDTINYTAVITNTAGGDASGVAYTDTLDNNTTLSGLVRVSPVTVDDSYTCTGNVSITVPASGVLANDYSGQNSGATTITSYGVNGNEQNTIGNATPTAQAGSVSVNADGSFTYNPPANFTGSDTFHYTLTNTTGSSIGLVTIAVSDRILFVNGAGGNCKPATPCTFATADALVAPTGKDLVFVLSSGSPYAGAAISLNSAQTIAGQAISIGQALTDAGITLAPNSQTLTFPASTTPVLNNAATIVTLNTNTLVEYLTINPSAGSGILGNAITTGTTTVRNITIGATGAANGVNLTSNTGGTFNFSNITITGVSGSGFSATGGGTVNVTGANNTIATTTGTALNITSTTIGGSGVTFKSIAANGSTNGIVLNGTGAGSFTVTGDGASDPANTTRGNTTAKAGGGTITLGSGGTIQNTTGSGILFTNTGAVTLTSVNVLNAGGASVNTGNEGIRATNVNGMTLDNIKVNGSTGNSGLRGYSSGGTASITNLAMQHVDIDGNGTVNGTETNNNWNVRLDDLAGNCGDVTNGCGWNNSLFFNSRENIVFLNQGINFTSVSTRMTITNSEFRDTTTFANPANDAFGVSTFNTAVTNITATGSTFKNVEVTGFQYAGNDNSSGTINVRNSSFENTGTDINITHGGGSGGNSALTFDISGNTERTTAGNPLATVAVNVFLAGLSGASSQMTGTIKNNTIGAVGVTSSGSHVGDGIDINATGAGTITATVTGNTVHQIHTGDCFFAEANSGSAKLNVFMHSNSFNTDTTTTALTGAHLVGGAQASDTANLCVDMGANTLHGDPTYAGAELDAFSTSATAIKLVGYGGANDNNAQISAFVVSSNTSVTPAPSIVIGAGSHIVSAANCGVAFPPIANSDGGDSAKQTQVSDPTTNGGSSASPAMFARLMQAIQPVAAFAAKLNFLRNGEAPTMIETGGALPDGRASAPSTANAIAPQQKGVTPLAGETISFNLPVVLNVGRSVTIKYDATINVPPGAASVQTQGNVTFTGGPGGGINTTDLETGTQVPTKTNINTAITWIGVTSTDWNTASNWDFNFVPLSFSDVKVPNAAQPNQPTLSTTSPTINSLNLGNTRVLTISGQTLTISGNSGSDLTLDGNINGGALSFGAGTHTIFNAGPTGSITPTNTTTVLNGANVTLNNNLQMDSLTISSGGTLNISNRTLSLTGSLNNGGTFTLTGSTVIFNGTGAQTLTNTTAFNNLTINNTGGSVTLGSNATVNGTLTLTSDLTTTNAFTLTMPTSTGIIAGGADVVGNITRTNGGPSLPTGTNIAFGNPNTTLNFIVQGTVPTSINFRLTKTAPTDAATGGTNTGFPGAVHRTWLITQVGGSNFKATMQLHYLVGDLGSNVETNTGPGPTVSLRMYKYVIASPGTGWQQQDFPAFANTTIDTSSPGNHFVKYTNVTSFSPWTLGGVSPTAATSTVTGRILDDAGNPVEGAVVRLSGTQERKTITDAFGNYSFTEVETNGFYTVTPSRVNYNFAPSTRGFSALGAHTEASFAAAANGNHQNPLDTTEYFVRQQYVDFLGREPEEKGFNDWTDTINNCAGDASCDRVHVSEMFFRSEEFQQRGYFVYRFYSVAFGQKPDYAAFAPDLGRVSGFLDATQLEAAKTQFANDFTMRPAFINQYGTMNNAQYVDALAQTAGVTLSNRQALVNSLEAGTMTRAQALRQIAESGEVYSKYYNQAFVVMEYFGYLRRDPDILYLNWISVLDANPADSRHMVEGFVDATEYRNRFKQ